MSQGSSGNVIAALVSFFIPGLGQLIPGPCPRGAGAVHTDWAALVDLVRLAGLDRTHFFLR